MNMQDVVVILLAVITALLTVVSMMTGVISPVAGMATVIILAIVEIAVIVRAIVCH